MEMEARGSMRLQLASDRVEGPQAAGMSYTCVSGLPSVMKSGQTTKYGVSEERAEGEGKLFCYFLVLAFIKESCVLSSYVICDESLIISVYVTWQNRLLFFTKSFSVCS